MVDSLNITSPSPNMQHRAHFAVSGEVRFGPLYYVLSIDNYIFEQRIFGDAHLWSPGSDLIAVQEWLTLDYSAGPITALLLIDVVQRREVTIAQATKRFLVPERFEGSALGYREEHAGQAIMKHFNLADALGWKPFAQTEA